ncbi:MAG TPA: wax ester/triacylglycerol synthase family O-acyltransferase, partial [Rubrivivax sp.]|nr:wax ester/triacylglycerol synthase family O-acyltransferase [Rubrivivax sp.]
MAAPGAAVRERITGEDCFWWSLEGPQSPMGMLALLRFGQRPRRRALQDFFDALRASHRRFRQRLVTIDGQGYWEDVARVARSRHLRRVPLDAADGADENEQLHALLSRLAGTPLDPQRPLWQLIDVPLAQGSALLVHIHHAIGDGMALLRVLLELSDRAGAQHSATPGAADGAAEATAASASDSALLEPTPARTTPPPLSELAERLAAALRPSAPGQSPAAAIAELLAEVLSLSTIPDESANPLKGTLSGRRLVASSRALPSAEVRRVAR